MIYGVQTISLSKCCKMIYNEINFSIAGFGHWNSMAFVYEHLSVH